MKHEQLPLRWQARLAEYLGSRHISAVDFPCGKMLKLGFPDGSQAQFLYAFAIQDPDHREIAVFTEHCGYHIFPLTDTEIEEASL